MTKSSLPVRALVFAALLALSTIPLVLRILYLDETDIDFMKSEALGFGADLLTGLGVALGVCILFARSRILGFIVALLWVSLCFGWYEFQRQFGSPYFLAHALYMTDATFLKGSAAGMARPVLAAVTVALVVVGLWLSRRVEPLRHRAALAVVAVALVVAPNFPPEPWGEWGAPEWRERNFLSINVVDVARRTLRSSASIEALAQPSPELERVYTADLDGTPILPFPSEKRNVILIMVESVSGGSFPSLASHHGVASPVRFDGLDRLARENLSWSTFLTHQRQTNRGEYSALCGDYPKLAASMAKMTEVAHSSGRRCLPRVLKDQGYNTLYIQSANLTFMYKHLFMPKIGFDASHGEDWFDPKYPWGGWGVDDRALYESALPEVERLDGEDAPYFLTLMTSGTHHPFHMPDDYKDYPDAKKEFRAMQFADVAVSAFLAKLGERGLLDDTLVLVTSDEASFVHEVDTKKSDQLGKFTANWGFMVAVTPERATARIDTPVQQADIALSVLDYLGLAEGESQFIGRSLFRSYAAPRPLFFANLYDRMAGSLAADGTLHLCDEQLGSCNRYSVPDGRIFGPDVKPDATEEVPSLLRAVQARSLRPALPEPVLVPTQ